MLTTHTQPLHVLVNCTGEVFAFDASLGVLKLPFVVDELDGVVIIVIILICRKLLSHCQLYDFVYLKIEKNVKNIYSRISYHQQSIYKKHTHARVQKTEHSHSRKHIL